MDSILRNRSLYQHLPHRAMLSKDCAVQIPNSKLHSDQLQKIISYFKSSAYQVARQDLHNSSYEFWQPLSIRALDPQSVADLYNKQKISQVEYLFRHHPNTSWYWRETPLTNLIQEIVTPFLPLFDFFSRVKIHLQQPQTRVGFHRDLTAGQTYNIEHPLSTEHSPSKRQIYQMYPWVCLSDLPSYPEQHPLRNQFSLKIPISELKTSFGRQTIFDEKPYYYTTNGNAYFLNETCYHGSDPVPYLRGLIFIDGIINQDVFNKIASESVACEPYAGDS